MTTTKPSSPDLKTFKEAYEVLQNHATTLRDQDEPNIDDLLTIVNESVAAYKICKQRIDAVEQALQEALDDPALAAATRTSQPVADSADGGSDDVLSDTDEGDDIPF